MNNKKSIMMLIGAMSIFGTIGIFRKYIPLSSSVIALTRGICGSIFLTLYVKLKKENLFENITLKQLGKLFIIGALIGINWIFLFEAYNYTTVACATLCYYMAPTIIICLSIFLLKEKTNRKTIICAVLSVLGMILVTGVVDSGFSNIKGARGLIYALIAAVLYAIVIIMNKTTEVEATRKTTIELLSAAITIVPYVLIVDDVTSIQLNILTIVLLLVVGIVHTGIAYVMYFKSIEDVLGQTAAIISYLDPVIAVVLSNVILHESMSITMWMGATLIMGSAIVSEYKNSVE